MTLGLRLGWRGQEREPLEGSGRSLSRDPPLDPCTPTENSGQRLPLRKRGSRAPRNHPTLAFGDQKINLHEAGHEFEPKAATPLPGTADRCFIVDERPGDLARRLERLGQPIELGPVRRDGAIGTPTSSCLRDPDGNLVELSSYVDDAAENG